MDFKKMSFYLVHYRKTTSSKVTNLIKFNYLFCLDVVANCAHKASLKKFYCLNAFIAKVITLHSIHVLLTDNA